MFMALLVTLGAAGTAAAQTYHPDFDPSAHKGKIAAPNEVMVLGTPHLSTLAEKFDPTDLQPLLARLKAWQPRAIAIEALSGAQCEFMRDYPARYRDSIEAYCWDPAPAKAATGLDVPAATAEANRLLAAWPAEPTPAQRRRLAAVFLSAGERASALVQWLRLPASERRTGDGLNAALAALLDELTRRRNETTLIAAPLAAQLGLERVYPMDDHTADAPIGDEKAYAAAITQAWDNPATAKREAIGERLAEHLDSGEGVLAMYREYNVPEMAGLVFESDFGAALSEPSPQRFGRQYLGYWETRNLRMAANIRDMLGMRPGTRALIIVGASHKGYLEAYLDQMHDVQLVDPNAVLN